MDTPLQILLCLRRLQGPVLHQLPAHLRHHQPPLLLRHRMAQRLPQAPTHMQRPRESDLPVQNPQPYRLLQRMLQRHERHQQRHGPLLVNPQIHRRAPPLLVLSTEQLLPTTWLQRHGAHLQFELH